MDTGAYMQNQMDDLIESGHYKIEQLEEERFDLLDKLRDPEITAEEHEETCSRIAYIERKLKTV